MCFFVLIVKTCQKKKKVLCNLQSIILKNFHPSVWQRKYFTFFLLIYITARLIIEKWYAWYLKKAQNVDKLHLIIKPLRAFKLVPFAEIFCRIYTIFSHLNSHETEKKIVENFCLIYGNEESPWYLPNKKQKKKLNSGNFWIKARAFFAMIYI